ncbi:efflux RND transporter periplasmic adaptor subunit [Pseudoalteromonas sp. CO302Y]|uniref:efflux RND transporter periplasmic adaptor subunit n=1 Tax=unclassified Pseudoalteromonas TaxID=194690 RepID=UPI001022EDEA|nr:efflux RND transporter periplasmic adaptor subunit [Pseudoalteromonas sp. CO302Y]RZG10730.1 efflux RND transporter periplasmic adaptor subunit [Pseudoalteromonas sp. CO133X]
MKLGRFQSWTFLACISFITVAHAANVVVQPVRLEQTKQQIKAVGNAEAIHSVTLYPAVGDRVTHVHFKPGDNVEKGELLLELDSRRQKAALTEARITLQDTQRTMKRLVESHARGAVPQSDLDDAKTLFELAKVQLTQAETELEDRQVRAPFSGVMGLTDVEVGDRITTQTAIATIDDATELYINFNAPEAAVNVLRSKGSVEVTPWLSEKAYEAKIAQLDSRINGQTRTLRTKAKLDNSAKQFMPGMSFRVNINILGDDFAVVPEAAMMWGAAGPYVWKSADNKATRVDVKIEQRLAGRLLVSGGLKEGDLLVTEGVQRLRPDQELVHINDIKLAKEQ